MSGNSEPRYTPAWPGALILCAAAAGAAMLAAGFWPLLRAEAGVADDVGGVVFKTLYQFFDKYLARGMAVLAAVVLFATAFGSFSLGRWSVGYFQRSRKADANGNGDGKNGG